MESFEEIPAASAGQKIKSLTLADLSRITSSLSGECELSLPFVQCPLVVCKESLRFLSGRRWVFKGVWNRQVVCVKLFFHYRKAMRDWKEEKCGHQYLVDSDVLTPVLLYSSHVDGVGIMIYAWLDDAKTLGQLFSFSFYERLSSELLRQLMVVLAQLHNHRLVQVDVHLDNFILSVGRLYCVDVGSVRKIGFCRAWLCSRNLAMCFAQFPAFTRGLVPEWLGMYHKARGWDKPSFKEVFRFLGVTRSQWAVRRRKWLAKVFRSCSAFIVEKSLFGFMVYGRHVVPEFLYSLCCDYRQALSQAVVFKAGRSSEVYFVNSGPCVCVVKVYRSTTVWHAFRKLFRSTRAGVSWRSSHLLSQAGVKTPKALAFYERRYVFFKGWSFFVTEHVEGVNGAQFFGSEDVDEALLNHGVQRLVYLLYKLYMAGISHGDMKWHNFIFVDNDWYALDLDQVKYTRFSYRLNRSLKKDVERLLKNWHNMPVWQMRVVDELKKYSVFSTVVNQLGYCG